MEKLHVSDITYSMEQNPSWEANRFSASQETPHLLWKPKVQYSIHTCPPPVTILNQLDPVHTSISHLLKIHLNIILPSTPGSAKWSLSLRVPHQTPVYASPLLSSPLLSFPLLSSPLLSLIRVTYTAHLILLDFITRTILSEEYRSLSSSLCSFLHSPVTSSLLGLSPHTRYMPRPSHSSWYNHPNNIG